MRNKDNEVFGRRGSVRGPRNGGEVSYADGTVVELRRALTCTGMLKRLLHEKWSVMSDEEREYLFSIMLRAEKYLKRHPEVRT